MAFGAGADAALAFFIASEAWFVQFLFQGLLQASHCHHIVRFNMQCSPEKAMCFSGFDHALASGKRGLWSHTTEESLTLHEPTPGDKENRFAADWWLLPGDSPDCYV